MQAHKILVHGIVYGGLLYGDRDATFDETLSTIAPCVTTCCIFTRESAWLEPISVYHTHTLVPCGTKSGAGMAVLTAFCIGFGPGAWLDWSIPAMLLDCEV